MRITFFELGKIHHNFGFLSEDTMAWIRAHDLSTPENKLHNVSSMIAQPAFGNSVPDYLSKYGAEVEARDKTRIHQNFCSSRS
jgi:hypothetical protein